MKKFVLLILLSLVLTACGQESVETPLPETTAPVSSTEATTVPATFPGETTRPTETTQATEPTETTEPVTEPAEITGTHVHSYTPTVIPATCTAPGTTAYFCDCGDMFTEGNTPPQGHSFGEWVLIEPGLEQRTCADCGETEENYTG